MEDNDPFLRALAAFADKRRTVMDATASRCGGDPADPARPDDNAQALRALADLILLSYDTTCAHLTAQATRADQRARALEVAQKALIDEMRAVRAALNGRAGDSSPDPDEDSGEERARLALLWTKGPRSGPH